MRTIIYISFLLLMFSCNQSTTNTFKDEKKAVVKDTVKKPIFYEFKYDGMMIVVKGRGSQNKDYKGKIKLLEHEIQIFNGNDGEKYFIKNFKREEKKTCLEADFGSSIAKFNITEGAFSEISLYSNLEDKKSVATNSNNNKDSLYNWNKEYKSAKYGYSIKIPETFNKTKGNRPHIDLKFVDAFGSSFLVNVSPRQKDEYGITAYNYTKDMLEQSFRQGAPNVVITFSEKLMVAGEEAFLIEYENGFPNMKSMECYLYHKDFAYVLTGACEKSRFSNYRQLFKNGITSLHL